MTKCNTGTHATVNSLTRRMEWVGHKLYIDSFVFLYICDDMHTTADSHCGTVRQNHKEIPGDIDNKTLKLKCGHIYARMTGVLTAMIW
jgi:hypothetical protein